MKIHLKSSLFKLPLLRNYTAIVLGRHCFTSLDKMNEEMFQHEMVHQKQMDEYGVLKFYIIYLKDYFLNLVKYRNHDKAYFNIPFEVEAYSQQDKNNGKDKSLPQKRW